MTRHSTNRSILLSEKAKMALGPRGDIAWTVWIRFRKNQLNYVQLLNPPFIAKLERLSGFVWRAFSPRSVGSLSEPYLDQAGYPEARTSEKKETEEQQSIRMKNEGLIRSQKSNRLKV